MSYTIYIHPSLEGMPFYVVDDIVPIPIAIADFIVLGGSVRTSTRDWFGGRSVKCIEVSSSHCNVNEESVATFSQ